MPPNPDQQDQQINLAALRDLLLAAEALSTLAPTDQPSAFGTDMYAPYIRLCHSTNVALSQEDSG
jgi:hypothetical protein